MSALATAIRLHRSGRLAEAERAYRQILDSEPDNADALQLLGVIANQAGQPAAAADLIRRALAVNPDHADAHCNLGVALLELGDQRGADAAFHRALAIEPAIPEALNNLGNIARQQGRLEEAEENYRRALQAAPGLAETHSNLGVVLHIMGRFVEAEAGFRQALAIDPDNAEAHTNLAATLLQTGRLKEGWAENEWRWRKKNFSSPARNFIQPRWDGSPLDGKTVLLHAEQGFGDTILFIRYAPLCAKRGGRVVVECQPQLKKLLAGASGIDELAAQGEPLPRFDVHLPMASLPLVFGTTLDSIPSGSNNIRADPALCEKWQGRLPEMTGCSIGLVWQGNKAQKKDRTRSLPLALLAPLLEVPFTSFVSLQKGDGEEQISMCGLGPRLVNPASGIGDFADTAAIIELLDMVICVDTAAAHLAAALGKPTWVLLEHVPDWRYMQDGDTSPWSPSMRLFRQTRPGDWKGVVSEVKRALGAFRAGSS